MAGEPAVHEGDVTIQVQACYGCGGTHEVLDVKKLAKALPPFTHWYLCPTTGDPVPMTILMFDGVQAELHNRVMRDVFEQQGKRSIFATFAMQSDGEVNVSVHTNDFPHRMLDAAGVALRKAFAKLMPLPQPVEPLPRANLDIFKTGITDKSNGDGHDQDNQAKS